MPCVRRRSRRRRGGCVTKTSGPLLCVGTAERTRPCRRRGDRHRRSSVEALAFGCVRSGGPGAGGGHLLYRSCHHLEHWHQLWAPSAKRAVRGVGAACVQNGGGRFSLDLARPGVLAADRLHWPGVMDFVLFHIETAGWSFRWYVFNLADVAIVGGVAGLLYDSLRVGGAAKAPDRG